jgi:hypothetical protein
MTRFSVAKNTINPDVALSEEDQDPVFAVNNTTAWLGVCNSITTNLSEFRVECFLVNQFRSSVATQI